MPQYIQKRYKRYLAVLDIPKDLRKHYPGKTPGKHLRKLVQSLETDSLSVAQRRAAPIIASWKGEFARLREEPDDAAYFRRQLQKAKTDAEREKVLEQIDLAAQSVASPAFDPRGPEHRIKASLDAGHEAAEAFYERATGQITGTTDFLEDWLAHSQVQQKTKDMNKAAVLRFAQTFPTLQEVTHEGVQRWVDGLGVSPATAQRMLSGLRSYWKHLQRPDVKAVANDFQPLTGLDLRKPKGNRNGSRRPFSTAQVRQLVMEADDDLRPLIQLAMWTGARIEELCSLKVEETHLNAKVPYIDIRDAKTQAGVRQVPVHPQLLPTLSRLVEDSADGYVLTGLTENKYGDRSNAIGKRFGRLKKSLGHGPELVFHSIRRSVSTLLENAGVPENVAADILGHEKPRITYGLYSGGASLKAKADALGKVSYGA